ncbi:hypothetical protein [Bradyrhizobium macuxiense]|uniref:hypothetical protein n=1 Tax=Bradyrhizobium macuxiense TaxID=1755647 RepID=UPI0011BD4FBA|nr:hypothetical protein [Bradyrhizobium macuxiense]
MSIASSPSTISRRDRLPDAPPHLAHLSTLTALRDIEFRTMKPSRDSERKRAFPLFLPIKNALLVL